MFYLVEEELPIEINCEDIEANIDTVFDHRVLSMRNEKVNAIFKIEAEIAHGFSEYLLKLKVLQKYLHLR